LPLVGRAGGAQGPLHPPSPSAAAGPPPRAGEDWGRALAAFEAAAAELRAFERRTAGVAWEAQEAVEREMDERLDALGPALMRLVYAPAPDLAALATKIALIEAHEVATLDGGEGCLAMLVRDVRRLIGHQGPIRRVAGGVTGNLRCRAFGIRRSVSIG
jgi:hypothetical protein